MTPEAVREALLAIWGEQACRKPDDWPKALRGLMKDTGSGDTKRASYKPRLDHAVATLTEAYSTGLPRDGAALVWQVFPMLTRTNCARLAARLEALTTEEAA